MILSSLSFLLAYGLMKRFVFKSTARVLEYVVVSAVFIISLFIMRNAF